MASLLLPIIYLAFISLGLPDSLLGSAWPVMYAELGATISWAGIVSTIISAGTVVSSLLSERLQIRFGTGRVTAVSVLLTMIALFGFSISHSFWMLCLFAIPYGLGAGSVDSGLNNYVALHYKARHMSWLHCMWGVGASAGPLIMSQAILRSHWNNGYLTIAIMQAVLTLVLFLTLPLWKDSRSKSSPEAAPKRSHSFKEMIAIPGVKHVLMCFFCYCAMESVTGMWAASYCTLYRGISAEQAASWASLFYIGITVGRFLSGFITFKVNEQNMIRLGQILAALGVVLVALPLGNGVLLAGLLMIGLGCAPIYPSVIHETPANFGAGVSQGIIGLQMAFAYIGTTMMPPLFGFLGEKISFSLFPYFIAVILVLMFVMAEKLHKATAETRKAWKDPVEG